jgi:hypothetical protein
LKTEKTKNGDKTWYKWKVDVDSMLTMENHVSEARSFSEEMAKAKDKLMPDQEEVKTATEDKIPF